MIAVSKFLICKSVLIQTDSSVFSAWSPKKTLIYGFVAGL